MALNALFTGSSALTSFSEALNVVGNNLANTNTSGFKAQRMNFKDLVYQTLSSGSGPFGFQGGTNPAQMGFGVGVGSIDTSFTQGNITATGRSTDVALQGQGFFVLTNGARTAFTRAGSFEVDGGGFLVDPSTGFRVQRFGNVGETGVPSFQTVGNLNIRVPFGTGVPGVATTNVQLQGNLSASTPINEPFSTSIQIFDTQSTPRALSLTFTKTATNTFSVSGTVAGGTVGLSATTVTFDNNGLLLSPASITATLTPSGANPLPAAQNVTLNLGTIGQPTGLTQFGSASAAAAVTQDGRGAGVLNSVTIDAGGIIQGTFSNGRTLAIAQLAVAVFNNPGGLLRQGENYYGVSPSSGEPLIGPAGSGGRGTIQGSALESSNVDISIEFSRLILAQRGFQVVARSVTAASEVLQELANIIR